MSPEGIGRRRFATTRWSLVLAAGEGGSERSKRALAELCAQYWYPLYAYARRRGYDPEDARDLTQAFFTKLLEKRDLRMADPTRGGNAEASVVDGRLHPATRIRREEWIETDEAFATGRLRVTCALPVTDTGR